MRTVLQCGHSAYITELRFKQAGWGSRIRTAVNHRTLRCRRSNENATAVRQGTVFHPERWKCNCGSFGYASATVPGETMRLITG